MNKKAVLTFCLGLVTGFAFFAALSPFLGAKNHPPDRPAGQYSIESVSTAPVGVSGTTVLNSSPSPAAGTTPLILLPPQETPVFKALFSNELDAHSVFYEVQSGDTLTSISKKQRVTIGLIKRINGFADDRLKVGQRLKIPSFKFGVVVDKSQNSLILKGDEEVLKTYTISTGTANSTPIGVFKITDRIVNPTWYKDNKAIPFGNPENILGTRWLGFDKKGYGIHGTTEPDKLGQQVTAGCVRMRNEEVEELFDFIPIGTEVTIVD